eukprot:9490719-Pyramimonas_sp.AAC.2
MNTEEWRGGGKYLGRAMALAESGSALGAISGWPWTKRFSCRRSLWSPPSSSYSSSTSSSSFPSPSSSSMGLILIGVLLPLLSFRAPGEPRARPALCAHPSSLSPPVPLPISPSPILGWALASACWFEP